MLSVLRDAERLLCVTHASPEIACFDKCAHQPSAIDYGRNDGQVETAPLVSIRREFEACLEHLNRQPVFTERIIALPKTVEQFAFDHAVAALTRETKPCLAELDGT